MTKIRPFLKWAGGKYNCLEHIISALPEGIRLIEPFSGSGVVFMNTNYSSYLLAESNRDLINIFNYLKKHGEQFIDYCQTYFNSQTNCAKKYYEIRSDFNKLNCSKRKAAAFLYLNRHGYNGLCRYNSSGIYNVPFGLYTKPYFPRFEMGLFHQKSSQAEFICNDFKATFKRARPGDVIYCDPPYVPLVEKTKPLAYTKNKFSEKEQIKLAQLAEDTAAKGIPVLISNHDTAFTRQLYRNAQIKSFPVSRWINCQSNMRQPAQELIALFNN